MIDIDHFKTYNDNYGHQAGDLVIRSVARCLHEFARRPLDLAARYGGEEFILVLYDVSSATAFDIAERLRTDVQKLAIDMAELNVVEALAVTVSVGVSVVLPRPGRSADEAMQLADEGLYDAKTAGRNRVVVKWVEDSACPAPGALKLA